MGHQIKRDRIYNNQKPTAGERVRAKAAKLSAAERRDGNSEKHLACIRKCWCVACLPKITMPCDPHHLKQGTGERGMQQRSTDRYAVPLCRLHHDEVERTGSRNEGKWFAALGIEDPLQFALDLHRNSGDVKTMNAVIMQYRGVSHAKGS